MDIDYFEFRNEDKHFVEFFNIEKDNIIKNIVSYFPIKMIAILLFYYNFNFIIIIIII